MTWRTMSCARATYHDVQQRLAWPCLPYHTSTGQHLSTLGRHGCMCMQCQCGAAEACLGPAGSAAAKNMQQG